MAQSATATFQFGGEPLGFTTTVNSNGFTPEIQGLETLLAQGCSSGITLASGVTSGSTSFTLSDASCVKPGMGLAFCPTVGAGNCTLVAVVKAAGCTANVCSVIQGTLGTTPGTYASGTPVTVMQYGTGGSLSCALIAIYQTLAQKGAVTVLQPANSALASTAVATQNTAITTAAATIASLINGAFTCVPTL
jgi:hypothetical protein